MRYVRFDEYCLECKYGTKDETEQLCNECLSVPFRDVDSNEPINFKKEDNFSRKKQAL